MVNLTKQIFKFKGLNLRTNELLKPDGFATSVNNVELTKEGYLTKRRGFAELVVNTDNVDNITYFNEVGILQFMEVSGQFTLNGERALLGLKADGIYGWDSIAEAWLKFDWYGGSGAATPAWTEPTSWVEYDGIVYMADPTGTNELIKVDPSSPKMYRAGLPVPDVTNVGITGAASTFFMRCVFEHADGQGNFIQGDYFEEGPITASSIAITLNTLKNTQFIAGDAISAETVQLKVYLSAHPTFGYRAAFTGFDHAIDPTNASQIVNIDAGNVTAALSSTSGRDLMSDTYDFTVRKGLPPKSKYVTIYNNVMILGDLSSANASDTNLINWSDNTTGGTVEAFPALNQQELGQSDEAITGLFGGSDNLIIFKERNVFYLSGDLISGNYRIRDSLSEGIGCVAHQSITKVEGGAMFLSEKGIYATRGGSKPTELSDIIEPLFTNVLPTTMQLSKAVSVLDRLNEKILLFIPSSVPSESIVVQYDYYFKEWFLYTGIDASGGFSMFQDNLVHTDGTKVFERHEDRNDDGVAISSEYATTWINIGVPSVKKKFTTFLAFSLDQSAWTLTVVPQANWTDTDIQTSTITFPSVVGSEDIGLPASQSHSLRLKLSNAVLDENILLNGYQYEYALTQTRAKGGD